MLYGGRALRAGVVERGSDRRAGDLRVLHASAAASSRSIRRPAIEIVAHLHDHRTPPTPRAKNAKGTQLWGPSGAAVWSAPTVDPMTRSLYVATGDAYSLPAAPMTDAIVALDLETGAIKWVNQTTAGDAFTMACGTADTTNCPEKEGPDHDFGQSPILVTLAGGKRRDRRRAEVRRRARLRSGSGRQEAVEHDGRPRRRARRRRVGIGERRTEHVRAAVRHHLQGSVAAAAAAA